MCSPMFLVFGILMLSGPSCTNSDNLELLSGTLRMRQHAACDDEMVSLTCPQSTYISIQIAKYGNMPEGHPCVAGAHPRVNLAVGKDCLRPNIMQYSLLQTVVEACQKKRQCEFSTKIKAGIVDPCPQAGKIVEVAYKCRPHEFHSRIVCEDDVVELSCNPNSRVVIYDAQYGRNAHESPVTCHQPMGVMDDTCSAPYALKTTMQICHGKQQCQIQANSKTFGSPCRPDTRAYLKVLYTCVPLGVLTDRYESTPEEDKVVKQSDFKTDTERVDTTGTSVKWKAPTETDKITHSIHSTSNLNGLKYKDSSTKSSNVKFLIYISIATVVVIILAAIFVGIRYYRHKKRASTSKNGDMFTTEAPNVFNDAASDLDNDVDVSHISGTFYDPVHPDMILYRDGPNKTTLRAMRPLNTVYPCAGASMYGNVDYVPSHSRDTRFGNKEVESDLMMSPKSLSGYTNAQFYYG